MQLRRLLSFFLYTHIFIALCASCLIWGSSLFFDVGLKYPLAIFAFCGTLWVYNLHRTVGALMMPKVEWPDRILIFYKYRYLNLLLSAITLAASLFLLYTHLWEIRKELIPPILISLAYIAPTGNGKLIRNIPFLKIFLISLTWTWVSILLPYALAPFSQLNIAEVLIIMSERFFFIFAITIPFDIRDAEQDARESLDTIVKAVGVKRAKYLSISLLIVTIIMGGVLYEMDLWSLKFWSGHVLLYVYAGMWIHKSKIEKSDYFYSLGLDGSMLLLGIIEAALLTF